MADTYEDELDKLIAEAEAEREEGIEDPEIVEEPEEEPEPAPEEDPEPQDPEPEPEADPIEEPEEKDPEADPAEGDPEPDPEPEAKEFNPVKFNVNGSEITLNTEEELKIFIEKGVEAMNKAPETHKEEKQIIEQGKLTQEDLNLLIDAKNGKPEAIKKLMEISGTDIETVNEVEATDYTPEFQAVFETDVDVVANDIMANKEHHEQYIAVSNTVPKEFIQEVQADANHLRAFSNHIKSGLAQKVIPEAVKQQALYGGSFLQHYATIGRKYAGVKETPAPEAQPAPVVVEEPAATPVKKEMTPEEKALRRKAAGTRGGGGSKNGTSVDDIASMPFEELMNPDFLSKIK